MRRAAVSIAGLALAMALPFASRGAAQDEEDTPRRRTLVWAVGGDASPDVADLVVEEVAARLRSEGLDVVASGELQLLLAPDARTTCRSLECARRLARRIRAPILAAVAVWEGDPRTVAVSLFVGRSGPFAGSAPVGEGRGAAVESAAAAVAAWREARGAARRAEPRAAADGDDGEAEARRAPGFDDLGSRPLEAVLTPIVLGVAGLVLGGVAVYALVDGTCQTVGPVSGECLVGERPNVSLGVTFAAVGAAAVVGAALWLFFGGSATPSVGSDLDIVQGPGDVGLGLQRRF